MDKVMDINGSCQIEEDGSHTVIIAITGISSEEMAKHVGLWARAALRRHTSELGESIPAPTHQ